MALWHELLGSLSSASDTSESSETPIEARSVADESVWGGDELLDEAAQVSAEQARSVQEDSDNDDSSTWSEDEADGNAAPSSFSSRYPSNASLSLQLQNNKSTTTGLTCLCLNP